LATFVFPPPFSFPSEYVVEDEEEEEEEKEEEEEEELADWVCDWSPPTVLAASSFVSSTEGEGFVIPCTLAEASLCMNSSFSSKSFQSTPRSSNSALISFIFMGLIAASSAASLVASTSFPVSAAAPAALSSALPRFKKDPAGLLRLLTSSVDIARA
jgi:hypothetical protein